MIAILAALFLVACCGMAAFWLVTGAMARR